MEIYSILGLIIVVVAIIIKIISFKNEQKSPKTTVYKYTPKNSLMTKAEEVFYWRLNSVAQDRYLIFPQVHLSALLDQRVTGQNWKHAFRHINGKSVDYVLCDKTTLQPVYAVELDDNSHDLAARVDRDTEVERIFSEANIPLVRFRNVNNLTEEDVVNTFANARKLVDSKTSS